MNLDFCFLDDAHIVAVTGWTTLPRPELRLHVGDDVLTPIALTRHVRRDLRSSEPMGVVALFDLSGLDGGDDSEQATIHLAEGADFSEIGVHRLVEDAHRLVEIGVDEVFFALLRLIAQGRLSLTGSRIGREICTRLRMAPSAPRETEGRALAVDRCLMTAEGQGAVVGWFMPAQTAPEPLCALAIEDEMIVPVTLLPASMARADLSGYAPRYRFSGHDGYCGSWRFPHPPTGAARLLLMVPHEDHLPGVLVNAETVPAAELAGQIIQTTQGIEDISDRGRLRQALLPDRLPCPALDSLDGEEPRDGDTWLILDHDLADHDLRDVLLRIGAFLPGNLRLHLLRQRLTPALQNALDGASREVPGGLEIAEVSLRVTRPDRLPARVVFARSATLFQLDPEPVFACPPGAAHVTLLDPIGALKAAPGAQAERLVRDLLPFVLSMPAAPFFAALDQIPRCFLTEEARLRLLAEALIRQDRAEIGHAGIHRHFEGGAGPHCQTLADGCDWHVFDAQSRKLIEETCA